MVTFNQAFPGAVVAPRVPNYYVSDMSSAYCSLFWMSGQIDVSNGTCPVARILDLTNVPAGPGGYLTFPDATQGSNGFTMVVNNLGPGGVAMSRSGESPSGYMQPGESWIAYITDNTTQAGAWHWFKLGMFGTNSTTASGLVGANESSAIGTADAINTIIQPIVTAGSPLTLSALGAAYVWTGAAGVATLVGGGYGSGQDGWFCYVANRGTGSFVITPSFGQIDGASSLTIPSGETVLIVESASTFWSGLAPNPSSLILTQMTIPVVGGTTTLSREQYANAIQIYTGALTQDQWIYLPPTTGVWYILNQTSGAFKLQFSTNTVGALTVVAPQGQQTIIVCDGGAPTANLYNVSSAFSAGSTMSLASGSVIAPSLSFSASPSTGMFMDAYGTVAFAASSSPWWSMLNPFQVWLYGGPNYQYWTGGTF